MCEVLKPFLFNKLPSIMVGRHEVTCRRHNRQIHIVIPIPPIVFKLLLIDPVDLRSLAPNTETSSKVQQLQNHPEATNLNAQLEPFSDFQ